MSSYSFLTLTLTLTLTLALSLSLSVVTEARRPRPDPAGEAAVFARWLVSEASWGALTILDAGGIPFNNYMLFADGGTGVPFFYLSDLDPTGRNAANGSRFASFTVSEVALGLCRGEVNPQSPACARVTLSGTLRLLRDAEAEFGEAVLFAKHPQLMGIPKMVGYRVYAMNITNVYLLNEIFQTRF